ncbi:hypothetical protein LTR70_001371 [Exophiala xenobiotica]|uniref:Helix-turn-helix domain-containing protein n=1 Tax=Lithohypha guttulata TaxID=1690604 RepID=A0ABR0KMC0_9EURO|nr:hypothetical protein LTR24_000874 [Lithohypha guttulata]KAK5328050.1 hypothetical protein LTR70_001371 [Exophiala xenobiotica]
MGSGASKQAGKAAGAAGRRQYPSSSSILNSASSTTNAPSQSTRPTAPAQVHPNPKAAPPTEGREPHVDLDGRDPQFGAALQRLGPAISSERASPDKAAFPTSTQPPLGQQGKNIFPSKAPGSNSGMMVVHARERIAQKYEQELEELGRASFAGRTLISAKDVKEALRMRDEGRMSEGDVEKQLRLKSGILSQLAKPGVYVNV